MRELTITHTHATGTQVTTPTRDETVTAILKGRGLRWSRTCAAWYLPGTRDRLARIPVIDTLGLELTQAGFTVTVTIDDTPRPAHVVEAARIDRATRRANRLAIRAEQAAARAQRLAVRDATIRQALPPMDEPIKPGHHSATKHTRAIDRANAARRALVEAHDNAAVAERAARIAAEANNRANNPATIDRRIQHHQTQQRRAARLLDKATASPVDHNVPGAADAHAATIARLVNIRDQAADHAAFWTSVREEQLAATPECATAWATVSAGDEARFGSQWATVVRVNGKSVTVKFPGGHQQRALRDRIDEVRPQAR